MPTPLELVDETIEVLEALGGVALNEALQTEPVYDDAAGLSFVGEFGTLYSEAFSDTVPAKQVHNPAGGLVMLTETGVDDQKAYIGPVLPDTVRYRFVVNPVGLEDQADTVDVGPDLPITSLVVSRSTADLAPGGITYRIVGMEMPNEAMGHWPLESAPLHVELPPCGEPGDCRVINRSLGGGKYLLKTWGDDPGDFNWDVLNGNEEDAVILPPDEEWHFQWRAWDSILHEWRGLSPVVTVETRTCNPDTTAQDTTVVDPDPLPGPRLDAAEVGWQSGWSLKFGFVDPLSVYVPSVEAGDYHLIDPEGFRLDPTGTPTFRNDSYFTVYCDGCASPGGWMMVLHAGAVADTAGTFNAEPDTVSFTY